MVEARAEDTPGISDDPREVRGPKDALHVVSLGAGMLTDAGIPRYEAGGERGQFVVDDGVEYLIDQCRGRGGRSGRLGRTNRPGPA